MKPLIPLLFLSIFPTILQAQRPINVLWVVLDDLRTELGCYGVEGVISPNIDRFAAKAMLFENAYAQYPVCNPSRASFLTGLRPEEVGVLSNKLPLRRVQPDIVTAPQLFRQNGYYTIGIGKIFHLSVDEPTRGRVLFEDPKSWNFFLDRIPNVTPLGKKGEGRNLTGGALKWAHWRAAEGGDADQADGQNADALIEKLEEVHEEPFFIGYGIHKPHDPFVAPKEYFDLYPKDTIKLEQEPSDRSELEPGAIPNRKTFSEFTDAERIEFKRAYQACVTFADAQLGKVFDAMDRLELWDSTMVIVMSDHGYHLGQKGWWNKVTLFETGSRVPFIFWHPLAPGMGSSTDSLVELVDIYPTLVELAGLRAPHRFSGKSLLGVLADPNVEVKDAAYSQVKRGAYSGLSVRSARWRYTEWGEDGKRGVELYDHSKDPEEHYNLARNPEYASVRERMKDLLDRGFSR
ncbi:MAG: sulfatase [Verrucomicrobiota bacterium]